MVLAASSKVVDELRAKRSGHGDTGKPHDGARIMRHIEDILNALICYVLTIVTQVVVFLSLDKSRPRWKIAWRLALAVVSLTRR